MKRQIQKYIVCNGLSKNFLKLLLIQLFTTTVVGFFLLRGITCFRALFCKHSAIHTVFPFLLNRLPRYTNSSCSRITFSILIFHINIKIENVLCSFAQKLWHRQTRDLCISHFFSSNLFHDFATFSQYFQLYIFCISKWHWYVLGYRCPVDFSRKSVLL